MTAIVVSLFPEEYPSFAQMLPVADVMPLLTRACKQWGAKGFARVLVHRIGGTYFARHRLIERLVSGEQHMVCERIADELAVGLGLTPELIWGDLWGQPLEEPDEVAV